MDVYQSGQSGKKKTLIYQLQAFNFIDIVKKYVSLFSSLGHWTLPQVSASTTQYIDYYEDIKNPITSITEIKKIPQDYMFWNAPLPH